MSFGSVIKVGYCLDVYLYSNEFAQSSMSIVCTRTNSLTKPFQSSMMPEEKRQLLLKVFSLLKQKIIWKVGGLSHPKIIE